MSDRAIVLAYTDGGCRPNPGIGGYAFVTVLGDQLVLSGSGIELKSTNQRMEMRDVIELLKAVGVSHQVIIHTDSMFTINTATKWARGWKLNGWVKADKQVPKNLDLVKELFELCESRMVTFKWIKGHNGDKWNTVVDQMATDAIEGSINQNI
jgi:ribonuclease HI